MNVRTNFSAMNRPLPFGRYRGRSLAEVARIDPEYLRWAAGTDIPKRYPEIGPALLKAAQGEIDTPPGLPDPDKVGLIPSEPPSLSGTSGQGGTSLSGVIELNRLLPAAGVPVRQRIKPSHDTRGWRLNGLFSWVTPKRDGVYQATRVTDGAPRSEYWLRRDGDWFRIDGGEPEALAVLYKKDPNS